MLFLRSTEPIVKLHLVAALGRIGDAQGVMPVMQYLGEDQDERGRGTAVFALGEIGSDQAVPLLNAVVAQDQSPMVRRLAKEALQKVKRRVADRARQDGGSAIRAPRTCRPIRSSPSCARWTKRWRTRSANATRLEGLGSVPDPLARHHAVAAPFAVRDDRGSVDHHVLDSDRRQRWRS